MIFGNEVTKILSYVYTLWIFSGLLTGLALLFPLFWILALVGLVLQLYLLREKSVSMKQVFIGATSAGTVHVMLSLLWWWSTVSLDWLGAYVTLIQYGATFVLWTISSVLMGLGYGLVIATLYYLTQRHWSLFALFPVAVLLGELLGRLFFSIEDISIDTGLSVAFGFGHVGYVLAEHQVLRIFATFGGVYVLSVLVGVLAVFVYVSGAYFGRNTRQSIYIVCFGIVILYTSSFVPTSFQTKKEIPKKVALVSTRFSMRLDSSPEGTVVINAVHETAVARALADGFQTVILPEDARFLQSVDPAVFAGMLDVTNEAILIIDSANTQRGEKMVLSAMIYDGATQQTYTYDKQHLVPFGEQLPIFYGSLMQMIGLSDVVSYLQNNFEYRVGISKKEAGVPSDLPAVLFCYESLVPYMARTIVDDETPFLAHLVSHAWFDDSSNILKNQLSAMLRIQALWNNVYILQSSNMAPSAAYTPSGEAYFAPVITGDDLWRIDSAESIVAGGRTRL